MARLSQGVPGERRKKDDDVAGGAGRANIRPGELLCLFGQNKSPNCTFPYTLHSSLFMFVVSHCDSFQLFAKVCLAKLT